MSDATRLNEAELIALGMSRPTVAAIRNMQRVTGATVTDATELAEVTAIAISALNEARSHINGLKQEIAELHSIYANQPRMVLMKNTDETPSRTVSLDSINSQIAEIKTYLGI